MRPHSSKDNSARNLSGDAKGRPFPIDTLRRAKEEPGCKNCPLADLSHGPPAPGLETLSVPVAYSLAQLEQVVPWKRSTTYKLIASGQLRALKILGRTIVTHVDLLALLERLPEARRTTEDEGEKHEPR
jgi:hypothetical protein